MQRRVWIALTALLAFSVWGSGQGMLAQREATAQFGSYRFGDLFYIKKVVWLIEKNYVEPQLVNPQKMFRGALNSIQMTVPAIMVKFSKDEREVEVLVDQRSRQFKIPPLRVISDVPYQLQHILAFIGRAYRGDVKLQDIEFAAIHGMTRTLDTHTSFLPPSFYKDMNIHTSGKFGGLGIVIQSREGFITVVSPMPGTPAAKAGLRPLDRIVRIGDESTINMDLTAAVNKLRGEPGEPVTIWVMRKGFSKPRKYNIVRAIIKVQSVTSHLLDKDIAYIQIKNFQQNTHSEMLSALEQMSLKVTKLRGLILDFRDNPGGLLDQAIRISDSFLKKGMIVAHAGGSSPRRQVDATESDTQPDYPIVVLVNQGSASASEIVAGALKNNHRALVIGQRTYGKGTVQVLYPIISRYNPERTALKLTVAQYLTPGDISIQDVGVAPDIHLSPVQIQKDQIQLLDHEEKKLKDKKLPAYLKGSKEQRNPVYRMDFLDTTTEKEKLSRYENEYKQQEKLKMDFEIKLAHSLLNKTKSADRKEMLTALLPALERVKDGEKEKIAQSLKKIGILWEEGQAAPANLEISHKILPPKPKDKAAKAAPAAPLNGSLLAGESYRLQLTVRNTSKHPAYRVHATTRSKLWFFNRREFIFGKILPGQSRKWNVEIKLPRWVSTQIHPLELDVKGANNTAKKKTILLDLKGLPRPHFVFSYHLEEKTGNGDGLIQPGETFSMHIAVRNQGKGKAHKVVAEISNEGGKELFIQNGRVALQELKPGQWQSGTFTFEVKKDSLSMPKELDIRLRISDNELLTSVQDRVKLPIRTEEIPPMPIKKRLLQIRERTTWLYDGAGMDAAKIAIAKKKTLLKADAKLGPFYRVLVPTKLLSRPLPPPKDAKTTPPPATLPLWLLARDVESSPAKAKPASPQIQMYWQYKTPEISFTNKKQILHTHKDTIQLKGSMRNNVPLLDAYVLVNREKVFYRALRNLPKLEFSLPIKLKKGRNSIIVVARETKHFFGSREIIIYYDDKAAPQRTTAITPKRSTPPAP